MGDSFLTILEKTIYHMDFYSVDKWELLRQCKSETIFYGKSSSTIRNKLNRETEKHMCGQRDEEEGII